MSFTFRAKYVIINMRQVIATIPIVKGAESMKITFTGKNPIPGFLIPPAEKKLSKFDRIFKDGAIATVKGEKKGSSVSVEITIVSGGTIYRSEKLSDTSLGALDMAIEAIERQIRKNKKRLEKRLREGAFEPKNELFEGIHEDEQNELIIKKKSFTLKPMSPEEAILQMTLLGHSFFVYENSETAKVNVVYLRNDGDYGLIEQD